MVIRTQQEERIRRGVALEAAHEELTVMGWMGTHPTLMAMLTDEEVTDFRAYIKEIGAQDWDGYETDEGLMLFGCCGSDGFKADDGEQMFDHCFETAEQARKAGVIARRVIEREYKDFWTYVEICASGTIPATYPSDYLSEPDADTVRA
jgi:hypothetical protein